MDEALNAQQKPYFGTVAARCMGCACQLNPLHAALSCNQYVSLREMSRSCRCRTLQRGAG